ncbi:phosphatase PAP2 family protein [Candidatus Daviesbacteria bacterium]|nr:phosphatase PAP2 family protein [Candidatus Daviesbacteria bacterium]
MPKLSRKILLTISLVVFVSFILFSYLVAKERFAQVDFDTTVKFQDRLPRRLDYPFSLLSGLGSAEVTGVIWLTILIISLFKRYWLTSISLFLMPIGLFLEVFGKLFVLHPAPPHLFYRGVIDYNFPSNFVHTDYSYPSGHVYRTSFLVFFLITVFYLKLSHFKQIFIIPTLIGLLVAMSISRIYLAEHWTTDVIGGLLLGGSLGIFAGATVPLII